ncbi:MAG: type II CAAX prenyl endopeptidase Rce1 family protein [Chloroflexota bacterium]
MNTETSVLSNPASERRPSLAAASLLYLLTLLLVAIGGSLIQVVSVPWGLIVTEIFLIFLPAYLFLRLHKLPVAETVRWRWPGGKVAALAVVIGLSLFQFVAWFSTVLMKMMNYSEQVFAGMVPGNFADALVMFIGMAILAPLCEEFLFRGVLQRSYERRGVAFAIGLVAVLFAFFHLSFLRFIGILPFALLICWMSWRSDSLVTGVLLHFSYNLLAPIIMLVSVVWPDAPLDWVGSLPVALPGLLVGLALLVVFRRMTTAPAALPERAPFGLKQAWPLLPAALIILVMAGIEMYVAYHPDLLVTAPVELTGPDWAQPASWAYEIHNRGGEPVGEATCQRALNSDVYQLDCLFDHQKAYEIQLANSYFAAGVYQVRILARWDKETLHLLEWQSDSQMQDFQTFSQLDRTEEQLSLNVLADRTPEAPLDLPADAFLPGEWPWRLSGLAFEEGVAYKATLAYPLKWSEEAGRSLPQSESLVLRVTGKETVEVPAGSFDAWKVTLGDETAWYAVEVPHTLIQYDDGMSLYMLR